MSGARGRGTNPKNGKNATPQDEGQLPAHTAIMLLRTMKLLFSFEQVKHCDFAVFYLIPQRFCLDLIFCTFRGFCFFYSSFATSHACSAHCQPERHRRQRACWCVNRIRALLRCISNFCTFSNGVRALHLHEIVVGQWLRSDCFAQASAITAPRRTATTNSETFGIVSDCFVSPRFSTHVIGSLKCVSKSNLMR